MFQVARRPYSTNKIRCSLFLPVKYGKVAESRSALPFGVGVGCWVILAVEVVIVVVSLSVADTTVVVVASLVVVGKPAVRGVVVVILEVVDVELPGPSILKGSKREGKMECRFAADVGCGTLPSGDILTSVEKKRYLDIAFH